MEEYHVNLVKWEENRENERQRLLLEEAKTKQGGASPSVSKRWNFLNKRMSRNPDNVEPGMGKWVSYLNREKKLDLLVGLRPTAPPAPKGLYIYGNVGSGKTMLMDMFYSATEGIVQHRKRLYFHEAMLQIHDLMHKVWKSQKMEKSFQSSIPNWSFQSSIPNWVLNLPFDTKIKEWLVEEEKYKQELNMKNILPAVADKFLTDEQGYRRGASILCFDEIQAVDVFAIVALSGIVSRLLSTGTVLVATSNPTPRDLNQHQHKGIRKHVEQDCRRVWRVGHFSNSSSDVWKNIGSPTGAAMGWHGSHLNTGKGKRRERGQTVAEHTIVHEGVEKWMLDVQLWARRCGMQASIDGYKYKIHSSNPYGFHNQK